MGCAKVAGCEDEDFEGEVFGFYHYEAGEGEFHHGTPVAEGPVAEAVPALVAVDEIDVKKKEDGEESLSHDDGDGGTNVAPVEAPDKEPVHEGVQWRCNEEDVRRCTEETLRLDKTFATLKERVTRETKNEHAKIQACQICRFFFRDYGFKKSV